MSEARGLTIGSRQRWRRSVQLVSLASLLGLPACAGLLGIEEVHEGPGSAGDASVAGGDSSAGSGQQPGGGHTNVAGGTAMAGKGGAGHTGGSSGAGMQGGSGNASAEAGTAGMGQSGGAGPTVRGHVIDFWGHQLANVSVELGGKTSTTDMQGAFSFDAVPAEYDMSLVVTYDVNGRIKTRAWVYQGLTRRDPTLQIYEGLTDRGTQIDVLPNDPSTLTGSRTLSISFGGPDGSSQHTDVSGPGLSAAHIAWQGPAQTQEVGHALIWEPDPISDFPSKFIAFDSTQIGLVDTADVVGAHGKASFDLSADSIDAGTIEGTVPGSGFVARFNNVFLRFTSNAVIKLLADKAKTAGFTYVVPSLPDASATLVAGEGDLYSELGVAHKGGLLPNASGLSLTIPTPARDLVVIPMTDATKVSATTQFNFTRGGGANAPFVATFMYGDNSVHDDILYLVSAKTPFKLPKVVNGTYTLPPGPYGWRVETHGAPQNVDAMAGPTGFLDAVSNSYWYDEPSGPRTGDGAYTLSKSIQLQLAP